MRQLLFIIVVVTVVGGLVAWQMVENGGYILIAYGNYTIDMSLWALLLILLAIWLVLRILKAALRLFIEPGQKFFRDRRLVRTQRYRSRTSKGLLQYIEGHWGPARRTLKRSAKHADMPLLNYLAAADAAYEVGDQDDADRMLSKAREADPSAELAIGLAQARMHLRDRHYEKALAILQRLHTKEPEHPLILRLLNNTYRGLEDWRSLEKLLSDFRRYKVFSKRVMGRVESEVYSSLLTALSKQAKKTGSTVDTDAFIQLWHDMPKHVKDIKRVLVSYITSLYQLGEANRAELLLRKSLKLDWDDELIRLYGVVESGDPHKQLITAEGWLRQRPNDGELMLALGRLSQRNQLWGKARDYLESAIALKVQPEAYVELARLMVHLGEHEKSSEFYQKGLALSMQV